jgi:hypothetical protein
MRTQNMSHTIDEEEGRTLAAKSMNLSPEWVERKAGTGLVQVYQGLVEERRFWLFTARRHPVRVLDSHGFIKVQRSDGSVFQLSGTNAMEGLKQAWENLTIYNGDSILFPNLFLIVGSHIVDFSGLQSIDHVLGLGASELEGIKSDEPVVIVGSRAPRGM